MSDSKDLESYGDWVKKPPRDIQGEVEATTENAIDDLDLPDFGDLDASLSDEEDDMFKDIDFTSTAEDLQNDSLEEDDNADTTLSPEELANITLDQETITEEGIDPATAALGDAFSAEAELSEKSADENLDEFSLDDMEIPDFSEEATDEIVLPDEGAISEDISIPEESSVTEDVSFDDMGDGEIDLGDFMSDSGGGEEISFGDGEIDLGDFMSDDFMGGSSSSKAPAEIQDEQTLDINVDFDEEAASIAIEDTPENEAKLNPKPAAPEPEQSDAMFIGETPAAPAPTEEFSAEDGEIDLSEFGFDDDDSNIGMTNGPAGSESTRHEKVDYDMRVVVDDDSKTPPVQDVVNGKIAAEDEYSDSEEDEITANNATYGAGQTASPEISEKGKEILEQIMGELSSLKDEIKNLKSDFAELSTRPVVAAPTTESAAEDSGFFGSDDGDDTIALSGSEITNILNSAEFSEEPAVESSEIEEPVISETPEPELEETSIPDDDLKMDFSSSDMEEPTIERMEISPEDLADTTDEFGEANVLPEEISVPKDNDISVESSTTDLMDSVRNTDELNSDAIDTYMSEDISETEMLTDDHIDYLGESPAMESEVSTAPSVDDIMQENISLQEDESVGIEVGDIDDAFAEADAAESDIMDSSLEAKDAYEDSVSGIMQENISLQEDESVGIEVGDIDDAFAEADAAESDIIDESLAEKDAYESKIKAATDDEPAIDDDFAIEDETDSANSDIPQTIDETPFSVAEESSDDEIDLDDITIEDETPADDTAIIEEPSIQEPEQEPVVEDVAFDEPFMEEPVIEEPAFEDSIEETSVEEPTLTKTVAAPETQTSLPRDLKAEVISVLSYMDQLLENLPEDKITEFAKSEHFVTYKKLFDELGLS